ncbi:transposase [Azotobacter vinelandii CA]|uniref:Transposase n=3 Tax=Azotobacter vinelandii TaxID=354 RepID=C1DNC8_AZOVD|nr:IS4-like element ISAzvi7 family transposase [Azotobacter vinelandii]ACO79295.1 transposase [Azotobacter vinelandii DJ]AGK16445.1 transposase [Azotobacter vinelandii CA]AGK21102.1 transposase [Azotobacter vinelandii CA6]
MTMNWAEEEMQTADLGDERLNVRVAKVLERLGAHPGSSIPAACRGWAETMAAYRFFDHEKATFETVLTPHRDATLQRMECCPVVLLVQDTTELDKWVSLGPKGVGTLKEQQKYPRRLHPTVAFTPERICLGVVEALWWSRDEPSPRKARRGKGVDEKESRRGIDSYQASCALQGQIPKTQLVNLADAEGDLYEWFTEYAEVAPSTRAQWIVRAAQDRRVLTGDADKLWASLAMAPGLGQLAVEVRARPKRPARQARVTLRSATVVLRPPARIGRHLPEVSVNAVLAREENPPEGVEPLEWLLLTSLPVGSLEQASTIVAWYAVRWYIEIYFHVLKNGCQINCLQLETEERLLPCIGLYLVVAWRVLYSLMLGRACPELNCELIFEAREWRAAYLVIKRCPPLPVPPRLGEMVEWVAGLGGYLGRKHDGPPGPKAMWIGLQRLREFVIALEARDALAGTYV